MPIDNELSPTCVQNCNLTLYPMPDLLAPRYACPDGYKLLDRVDGKTNEFNKLCVRTDGSDRPRP